MEKRFVYLPVAKIELTPTDAEIGIGETARISPEITSNIATDDNLEWELEESSADDVAECSASGDVGSVEWKRAGEVRVAADDARQGFCILLYKDES